MQKITKYSMSQDRSQVESTTQLISLTAQHDLLLKIKFHKPRTRAQLIPRSSLVERVQQGMEGALTLISAPAGFGKTTLLAQWLAEYNPAAVWLSLEPEDNDPVRFLTYLIATLRMMNAHLGTTALDLLQAPQPVQLETVVALLANDLMHANVGDFALVLDDYHTIIAPSIHRALIYLVEHMPPQLHLIIVTRADPLLPLARLRAKGQLTEIRATELRFTTEEISKFLHTMLGLELPLEIVTMLERRTEGWIAGLQLAMLALKDRTDISEFFTVFTGSHRFVLDFLTEEVLARQPEAIQSFLLSTSILERLNGSLCEALTGQPGGQAMLQALERANLFVVPLDETRQWYRYHHLFAEMLQNRLLHAEPDLVSELHRRASNWYEQHAQSNPAIQHALAANDIERAADLIEQHSVIISQEQTLTLLNWLNALPDRLIRSRPRLCTMHAMLLIVTMQHSAAEARLYDAEVALLAGIAPDEVNVIRGQIALTRLSIFRYEGDLVQSVTLAQQALILLPETEIVWRQAAIFHSANAFLVSGDVTAVNDHVANLVASAPVSGDLMLYPGCTCLLASLWTMRGRLRKAIEIYRTITQVVPWQAPFESPIGPFDYFNLADLLRELNKLEEAELSLMHGMRLLKDGSVVYADALTLGHTTLARLQMAQGKNSEALATLDAYTQAASRRKIAAYLLARATTVRIQIKLAQGDLASAIQWVDESGLSINDAPNYVREREYLTLARVKIAQGLADRGGPFLKDALILLKRHLTDAEEKARTGSTIEILMLQALALSAQSSKQEALSTLQRALTLAEPEGYIRLFVDEGQPMLNLLREARACGILPDYVTRLLSLMDEQHTPNIAPADPDHSGLIEPLTEREREVLYLISTGASNGEIARRLIVSVNTVKRHVFNLCGKLSVQSRTQAIVRAQRLHLL